MKMPPPKKIIVTTAAVVAVLALVHFCFTPGLRAISTWIVYKTEGQKLQKDLEKHKPNNTQAAQDQPAAKQDLYNFAGDDHSEKP